MFNQVLVRSAILGLGYFSLFESGLNYWQKYKGGAVHAQLKFSIVEFQPTATACSIFGSPKNVRAVNPPDTHRDKPLTAPNQ